MNHSHSQGVPSPPVMVWNLPGSSIVSWHLECDHTWCIPPLCKGITVDTTRSGLVHIFSASVSHLGSWSLQCFLGTTCLQTPRSLLWLGSLSTLELYLGNRDQSPSSQEPAHLFLLPSIFIPLIWGTRGGEEEGLCTSCFSQTLYLNLEPSLFLSVREGSLSASWADTFCFIKEFLFCR